MPISFCLRQLPRLVHLSLLAGVIWSCHVLAESVPDQASIGDMAPPVQPLQQYPPDIDPELRAQLRNSIARADSFEDRFDAEVWLVQKSAKLEKYIKDPGERFELLRLIHREANRAGVPPEFVLAVIEIESHFDRYAVSSAGALGMMQIMPFWKKEIGREDDNLIDVQTNLRYGCTILKYYYDRAKGNWAEALARYNGSFGYYWTYSEKVMVAWQKNWR